MIFDGTSLFACECMPISRIARGSELNEQEFLMRAYPDTAGGQQGDTPAINADIKDAEM